MHGHVYAAVGVTGWTPEAEQVHAVMHTIVMTARTHAGSLVGAG